ncbi:hypothetical protein TWF281_002836 [Arthrobotrys megalospora]
MKLEAISLSRSLLLAFAFLAISATSQRASNRIDDPVSGVGPAAGTISIPTSTTSSLQTASTTFDSQATQFTSRSTATSSLGTSEIQVPPTQTSSDGSRGEPSTDRTGLIAGTVCGGIVIVVGGALVGLWMVLKERRRREGLLNDAPLSIAAPPPDPNNQGIWDGNVAFASNPAKEMPT